MLKIVVVEDEVIVAKDIQKTLIKLGFDVPATAATATQAFEKIKEIKPDLVMCDIKLKGEIDGIEVANRINELYKIPVIYLTSYVDKATLDRAKVTQPYGYIVKPFNESDLLSVIEMAVYKHKKDMELLVNEQRLTNTLNTINEAVIITDYDGAITFLNPRVETMLSLDLRETLGKNLSSVIAFDMDRDAVDYYHVRQSTQFKNVEAKIIPTSENQIFNLTVSPIIDEKHNLIGRAFVLSAAEKNGSYVFQRMALDNMVVQDAFFIKRGSQLIKVLTDNIFWVQAMDNYVIIQSSSDQFIIHSTMKEIESKLPAGLFARVHRSYIINISKIQMLDENDVIISEKSIPIGKSYKDSFKQRLSFL